MLAVQGENMETENKVSIVDAEQPPAPRLRRIKNSATEYKKGGVFEASHFAKGDGWGPVAASDKATETVCNPKDRA